MTFEVTIPVLNEEENLEKNIRVLHSFLKANFPNDGRWQIVIADNGSADKTFEIARRLSEKIKEVSCLKVPTKGVGLALKTSWEQSTAQIIGYMDLDLSTELPHFLEAYQALSEKGFDLVYGSRLHPESLVSGRTFKREITSRLFNLILKKYLKVRFSDGMCGFKFFKRQWYSNLYEGGAQNDGWFFSTELLTVAEWLNLKICELPVHWTDDVSSSRVKILPLAKRYLKAMWQLKKRKHQNP